MIHSMSLSTNNKRWLAQRLLEEADEEQAKVADASAGLKFRDRGISPSVLRMRRGINIPEELDVDTLKDEYFKEKFL